MHNKNKKSREIGKSLIYVNLMNHKQKIGRTINYYKYYYSF